MEAFKNLSHLLHWNSLSNTDCACNNCNNSSYITSFHLTLFGTIFCTFCFHLTLDNSSCLCCRNSQILGKLVQRRNQLFMSQFIYVWYEKRNFSIKPDLSLLWTFFFQKDNNNEVEIVWDPAFHCTTWQLFKFK